MEPSSGSGGDRSWRSFGGHDDPFDISGKGVSAERLKKWRKAALVLNSSRRFRYTLDIGKEQQKEEVRRKIRAQAHVVRAAIAFKEAGRYKEINVPHAEAALGFGIKEYQLTALTREQNYSTFQQFGQVAGIASMLKTDTEKGIDGGDSDLLARKNAFGSNIYPSKKRQTFLAFVRDACKDLTLIILMVAAAVSLAFGIITEGRKEGWYDGAGIAFAVLLVVFVTASSDYKESLEFQKLNEEKQNIHLEVVRGGRSTMVSIYDLVAGDVVPLKIGDQVPADGILITGYSLSIDESSMTGESKIVHKDHMSPFLMSGCKVAGGCGMMLVTAVGVNTEWGLLMATISDNSNEETPLQVRLNGITTFMGMVGLSVALVFLIILLTRYFTGHAYNPVGSMQYAKGMGVDQMLRGVVRIFTIVVAIVVVAVPEGLPLAVTLTIALSVRKMMRDKALIRRISACEMMGCATTICSDKTGTLTLSEMSVIEAHFGGKKIDSPDNAQMLSPDVRSLIAEGITQNTSGSIFRPEGDQEPEVTGSSTEKALMSWELKLGIKLKKSRSKSSILHVVPFNSEEKQGGVAVQMDGSEVHIHWKGAAEIILDSCTSWLDFDGSEHSMTPENVAKFNKLIEDMAAASLRCVAFAYRTYEMKDVPDEDQRADWALPNDGLIMLGIVGIKDPCRPGVRDSVHICMAAGIQVRMVTGDNLQTARAIALECGILTDPNVSEPIIIEGKMFRELSELERENAAEKISVMARSSPEDKLLLVQALRKRGHVVAVTGDGAADAPALHEADIGLSMGIRGTEAAKESSDIVILDDNFASVVTVVRWGRSVYANIQKFIQFQLTVNIAALLINMVAAISSGNMPLNAVQLLWVNLIMDTLGALALATEPPTDHLMQRPPVDRREPLITNMIWRNLIIMILFQVSVLLTLNFTGVSLLQLENDNTAHAEKVKNTFIFNTFVLCQVFNEFNSRKPDEMNIFKGISGNSFFVFIIVATVILQAIMVQLFGKFASTVSLSWQLWLVSIGLASFSWPLALVGKLIPVPDRPFLDLFVCCSGGSKQASDGTEEHSDGHSNI